MIITMIPTYNSEQIIPKSIIALNDIVIIIISYHHLIRTPSYRAALALPCLATSPLHLFNPRSCFDDHQHVLPFASWRPQQQIKLSRAQFDHPHYFCSAHLDVGSKGVIALRCISHRFPSVHSKRRQDPFEHYVLQCKAHFIIQVGD